MTNDEKILNIESQASDLYCLINTIMESCEFNDYTKQAVALRHARKIAGKIISKLSDINMEWDDNYFTLDID